MSKIRLYQLSYHIFNKVFNLNDELKMYIIKLLCTNVIAIQNQTNKSLHN